MQPWQEQRIEDARRYRRKHLDLSFYRLDAVPETVRGFQWLESIDLSGNQIRSLPHWLSGLGRLRELLVFDNPIAEGPADLPIGAHWSVIEMLGVPDERVRGVAIDWDLDSPPKRLLRLSRLPQLDLGFYQTSSKPPRWIEGLLEGIEDRFPVLETLNLRFCGLAKIPESVSRLGRLRNLDLSGNALDKLPDSLSALTRLQSLRIEAMDLDLLPDWVFALPSLRHLSAGYNRISGLPSAVRLAVRLETLELNDNPLESVPEELASAQRLECIDFGECDLREIPNAVYSLRRLGRFSVEAGVTRGINTSRWPERLAIRAMRHAKQRITEIPSEILKLTRLRSFEVLGQPIVTPPEEVVRQGLNAIRDYWRQREESGTDYLCEAKLLIVGEGGAGKTTLAAKILDPAYALNPDDPSTEGIDILRWQFAARIHPRADGLAALDRDFEVAIWDFGGQEIYHATHQFFLTRRSLYVLVADSRKEDTDFHYWLGAVALLAGDSPLIVVKNEKQDRRWKLDEAGLRARFPNVKEILAVNLATNRGLDEAVRRIRRHLECLRHIGDPLPATWKRVREALEEDLRDHMTLAEFLDLCERHGFTRQGDKLQLSAYLHDLGICLHKHTVILRPSWGTDAVYRVLDDDGVIAAQGHFSANDLARIWDAPAHAGMQDELLRLMMRFQLCYALPDAAGYIAPQLLPASRPAYNWDPRGDLVMRWVYGFMPKGILTRLTVATHPYIANAGRLVWRSGAVLEHGGARCEAVEDYQQRRLVLRAQGPGHKVLLGIVLHELERIHRSFPGLDVRTLVPCNCAQCAGHPEPESFPYELLARAAREARQIQCQRSWEMVDAAGLIDAVFDPTVRHNIAEAEYGSQEHTRLAHGPAEPRESSREVFVSYAWRADTAIVDALTDAMRARGMPVTRDKDELRYKDPIRAFMRRAGRSKAAVLVLSEPYLRSHNCMFELIQIAKGADLRGRVFPVVLDAAAIHDPIRIVGHIAYWESKIKELDEAMKGVEGSNLEGIRETLDLYREIRATIARLTDVLADMNHLTPAAHTGSGFAELAETVAARIGD
jgi:internalin A